MQVHHKLRATVLKTRPQTTLEVSANLLITLHKQMQALPRMQLFLTMMEIVQVQNLQLTLNKILIRHLTTGQTDQVQQTTRPLPTRSKPIMDKFPLRPLLISTQSCYITVRRCPFRHSSLASVSLTSTRYSSIWRVLKHSSRLRPCSFCSRHFMSYASVSLLSQLFSYLR